MLQLATKAQTCEWAASGVPAGPAHYSDFSRRAPSVSRRRLRGRQRYAAWVHGAVYQLHMQRSVDRSVWSVWSVCYLVTVDHDKYRVPADVYGADQAMLCQVACRSGDCRKAGRQTGPSGFAL
jgi:hypothetical protein